MAHRGCAWELWALRSHFATVVVHVLAAPQIVPVSAPLSLSAAASIGCRATSNVASRIMVERQGTMKEALILLSMLTAAGLARGQTAPAVRPDGAKRNACGCYRDSAGICLCDRKAKCGCPEECEPKGCEEKRAKELEKEIQTETKRAKDAEKKREEQEKRQERSEGLDEKAGDDAEGAAKRKPDERNVKKAGRTTKHKKLQKDSDVESTPVK